ncbi:MAG: hypothetical protein DRP09_12200 [Candidatus Thorarchaeota archaeon]|nr:MAG: hypothetical protein DRP09_12200 [Candidatus Thorarchaeota archaeon]
MFVKTVVRHVSDAVLEPREFGILGILPDEALGGLLLPVAQVLCDLQPETVRVLDGLLPHLHPLFMTLDVSLVNEALWRWEATLFLAGDCDFLFVRHLKGHLKHRYSGRSAKNGLYEDCPLVHGILINRKYHGPVTWESPGGKERRGGMRSLPQPHHV